MLVIKRIRNYTIPLYGNKRIFPYADLLVSDGVTEKLRPIKDDGAKQYITFNRKRHYIKNIGSLYAPNYVFTEQESVKQDIESMDFVVHLSILAREGETEAQTAARLNDVLADSLLTLADHHIEYTVERSTLK